MPDNIKFTRGEYEALKEFIDAFDSAVDQGMFYEEQRPEGELFT